MPDSRDVSVPGPTAAIRQRMLIHRQRLILGLPFNASLADSFTGFMVPVETSTTPYSVFKDLNISVSEPIVHRLPPEVKGAA